VFEREARTPEKSDFTPMLIKLGILVAIRLIWTGGQSVNSERPTTFML
jgi:hypothetical protein